ncbi:MAG TPA: FG-GAP-like repeat-containing protein [Nonomuraea sp.]|nr:FG-GAP-like repeat-containing protein [Nonomuraea sp.]
MVGLVLAVAAALLAAPGVALVEEFVKGMVGTASGTPSESPAPGRNPYLVDGNEHALTLAWHDPAAAGEPREYRVYGSTSPTGPKSLLAGGIWRPRFTHKALRAGQTWYYQVKAVDKAGRTTDVGSVVSGRTALPTRTDVNRDGRDDVVTFTKGRHGDVYVALSGGGRLSDQEKWHDWFGIGHEVPLVGDFNGDDRADLVTFTRGAQADVYVSLSDGEKFVRAGWKWHEWFAAGDEFPTVGDFNGDGKDDIATFLRGDQRLVYVSRSTGTRFATSTVGHENFARGRAVPLAADFDGDGRDDIASFGGGGIVRVALSKDNFFAGDEPWNEGFPDGATNPAVGDFDGDGRDDIAAFTGGTQADVYVALSDGATFAPPVKWHDDFAGGDQLPGAGDFDGDGRADVIAFPRGNTGDVYVAPSEGSRFAPVVRKWHDTLTAGVTWPQPSAIALTTG